MFFKTSRLLDDVIQYHLFFNGFMSFAESWLLHDRRVTRAKTKDIEAISELSRVAVIDWSHVNPIRSPCARRIEAKTMMLTGLRKPFLIRACLDAGSPSTAFGTRRLMRVPPFFIVGYPDRAPRATPSTGKGGVSTVMRQSLIASLRATATMAFCPIP
ncbi:hypothetical protein, partial [uncultured Tateyamaria sp.]|uniref:hypothetical protein n=1 Tax=uncultured Tateyamaria sp. TaxID=455651 RepID=UPI0026393095